MENNRFEQLSVIRDEMLADPSAEGLIVWNAAKLALEDDYLYDLMLDWMKASEPLIKKLIYHDVLDYTEEIMRKMKVKNEN